MKRVLFLLGCLIGWADAVANGGRFDLAQISNARQPPARFVAARAIESVVTTTTTGPGQAGYVHYFVIKRPDESRETQIGIELPDQRIAWSFPELGVVVSPFIESGLLPANGKLYEVQHLYGLRPFPDDASMLALQSELTRRVLPWVEDGTPHCDARPPAGELCVSCLGFVLRILFPGRSPAYPALPPDFRRVGPDGNYTTEDLLLYLTGLHGVSTREARLKRIEELTLPQSLRDELSRLVGTMDPIDSVGSADTGARQNVSAKSRAGVRSLSKIGQHRQRQRRNL